MVEAAASKLSLADNQPGSPLFSSPQVSNAV